MNDMKLISAHSTETLQEITVESGFWIFKKQMVYSRAKKNKANIFRITKSGMKLERWFGGCGFEIYNLMNYLQDTKKLY